LPVQPETGILSELKVKTMTAVLSTEPTTSSGFRARRLRIALLLTRQELATMGGVSLEEVDCFEHNLPVRLDVRRRLQRELWARAASRH